MTTPVGGPRPLVLVLSGPGGVGEGNHRRGVSETRPAALAQSLMDHTAAT